MSVWSVVCCQVEVSATGWSLAQRVLWCVWVWFLNFIGPLGLSIHEDRLLT
jgi:hypothetical protein